MRQISLRRGDQDTGDGRKPSIVKWVRLIAYTFITIWHTDNWVTLVNVSKSFKTHCSTPLPPIPVDIKKPSLSDTSSNRSSSSGSSVYGQLMPEDPASEDEEIYSKPLVSIEVFTFWYCKRNKDFMPVCLKVSQNKWPTYKYPQLSSN